MFADAKELVIGLALVHGLCAQEHCRDGLLP